jgi:GH25 family lysozyme M1 (1,4-beta-N-acetylmuramidase)
MSNAIIDLSHHQLPEKINYEKLAKCVDHAIIRTQYGSKVEDKYYKTHHSELRKYGVSTSAYAWVRGVNITDMEIEAEDFYNRTKDLNPEVYWLDVEERSMSDMRAGVSAYVKKLRDLGVKKIGIYVANNLYKSFNLNLDEVDAIWIPRYGKNDGQTYDKPDYPCCLWQYTSQGKLDGYDGPLDISVLNGDKAIDWFTGISEVKPTQTVSKPKTVIKQSVSSVVPYPGHSIKEGSRGKDVERIQRAIGVNPDGIFGTKTKAAVKAYQTRHNLNADGIVGVKTWSVMF